MPRVYEQSEKDTPLTATLPAWMWRLIVFAVEQRIQERRTLGHVVVASTYLTLQESLCRELDVTFSGDLPFKAPVYPRSEGY